MCNAIYRDKKWIVMTLYIMDEGLGLFLEWGFFSCYESCRSTY